MKTVQTTLLGLIAIAIVSCSKSSIESNTLSGTPEPSMQTANVPRVTTVSESKTPLLTASQDISPARTGTPVTIHYKATNSVTGEDVGCGRIFIYKWDGLAWNEVAVGDAPNASFTFTPQTADDCAYQFKAGFAPGGGTENCSGSYNGVDYLTQTAYCADVSNSCVESFTINSNVDAVNLENGLYEFSITYTLISPVDVNAVKFQGGATAGGSTGHAITDLGNTTVVNANNNNTVLKWEGKLTACQPQQVTFKYTRNFSCPSSGASVTGEWSAKTLDAVLGTIAPLSYSCQ